MDEERPVDDTLPPSYDESGGADGEPTKDERLLAMLAHIGALFSGGIILPLILYIVKKDDSDYIVYHARESLNFQITVLIVSIVIFIPSTFLCMIPNMIVGVAALVFCIIAGIKANDGERYEYPMTLRLVN